ncbi:MAG: hypothetical protein KGZ88_12040 [Methylomicrobium sp.]|nr:hypothetical protein [Methylomicrobium sp.]
MNPTPITALEIAQIFMIAPQTVSKYEIRYDDFPKPIGELPRFGRNGRPEKTYNREDVMLWFLVNRSKKTAKNKESTEPNPLLSSSNVAALIGIDVNNLKHFKAKHLDFPKFAFKKGNGFFYDEKEIKKWIEEHQDQIDQDEKEEGIRYTNPSKRERLTPPQTMHFAFISGHYAPRV